VESDDERAASEATVTNKIVFAACATILAFVLLFGILGAMMALGALSDGHVGWWLGFVGLWVVLPGALLVYCVRKLFRARPMA
jgi:hypothetical protein